ncbi:MAG TPA: CocE/NonD family hydrolase, partial [Gaiellaceae bacterium]|nr:CocE/NonD family hydrolase [Gaiellaceae bacterium]
MQHRRAWIPTPDGARLAARLWLPDELPAPALLEALPYRMDDLTASYASEYERLSREGGLAVARVDLRGTGSSEGIALDEYPPQEQVDLTEVIAWLAGQEWCTGRVGMYGASYSGFASLQVAA